MSYLGRVQDFLHFWINQSVGGNYYLESGSARDELKFILRIYSLEICTSEYVEGFSENYHKTSKDLPFRISSSQSNPSLSLIISGILISF